MEMFMKKLVFLVVFATILFLVARTLEYIAWYETGLLMMKLIDPVSLSVRKLKNILDCRGLSYEGVVDKVELTQLVKASGEVVEGEVLLMEQEQEKDEEEDTTTNFRSKARFDEEVEDKKDSVWLVQVIPRNHVPLLGQKAWSTVEEKLSRFGIRHGTFDCSIDPRICTQKNWNLPLLLLAMPQGQRHKDHVTMATFTSAGKGHQIIQWVDSQLASKVHVVRAPINDDLFLKRLSEGSGGGGGLKMVLFSRSNKPPMFFSALNLKYSGRVKFIFVSGQDNGNDDPQTISDQKRKYPAYVIVTPEGSRVYGSKDGEYYTYNAMDVYLRTMTPEANDIFILSFINVNIICFIGLFVIHGGAAKRICTFIWTIGKYNITFILLWLPVLGIIQLPCISPCVDLTYRAIRLAAESWLVSKLRHDWLVYSGHPYVMLSMFIFYCYGVNWLSKRLHVPTNEDRMTSAMWLRASLAYFYNFLCRPSPSLFGGRPRNIHPELEEFNMFMDQMAFPDLWLHPTIQTHYIQDLLTWRYSCDWLHNRSSSNDCDSSDSEKGSTSCRSTKSRCQELGERILKNTVACSCKIDSGVRDDFLQGVEENDNFFVVRSHEKPVSDQPRSMSRSNSEKPKSLGPKGKANSDQPSCAQRSEAQLDNEKSHLNSGIMPCDQTTKREQDSGKDIVTHCHCSYVEPQSPKGMTPSTKTNPESLGTCDMPVNVETTRENHAQSCRKTTSPKRNMPKVSKTKVVPKKGEATDTWPEGILFNAQCSICLDSYTHSVLVCGLPCGHAYHQQCIVPWLSNGNHECPICRWPAYKKKGCKLSKHME